jgi:predicted GNAT family N-acyltransferase
MQLIEFGTLSAERRGELEGDERDPWEIMDLDLKMDFQPKDRHVGLQDEDGTLVACAGIVLAEAQVGGRRFPVLGLGGVIVRAPFRGRGLAREIVEAAVAKGRRLGPPFALLFCLESRTGLYRRLGFVEVEGEVRVQQPTGYERMPLRTMWRALRPAAVWPPGELTLHSLPF